MIRVCRISWYFDPYHLKPIGFHRLGKHQSRLYCYLKGKHCKSKMSRNVWNKSQQIKNIIKFFLRIWIFQEENSKESNKINRLHLPSDSISTGLFNRRVFFSTSMIFSCLEWYLTNSKGSPVFVLHLQRLQTSKKNNDKNMRNFNQLKYKKSKDPWSWESNDVENYRYWKMFLTSVGFYPHTHMEEATVGIHIWYWAFSKEINSCYSLSGRIEIKTCYVVF